MKVLWCCNVLLPMAAEAAGLGNVAANSAGWIEGGVNWIKKTDVELVIACPYNCQQVAFYKAQDNVSYYLFPKESSRNEYAAIINDVRPDILHLFGTESYRNMIWLQVYGKPERTVVNIQGMVDIISRVYLEGISEHGRKERLFEKLIHNSTIMQQKRLFAQSKTENEIIRNVKNVIGRTDIDHMMAIGINPDICYYSCNEILRDSFYSSPKWDINKIQRHSIFVRNTGNPIKGLPGMLKALSIVQKKYPDVKLYVVGTEIFYPQNMKQRFVESAFNKECRLIINENHLENRIVFLHSLSAHEMIYRFLMSNVVVSASSIENESNFVSEAKLLGCPVVSSFVGGLPNRIVHGWDGFLYQFNLPQMLAYYIDVIFSDSSVATKLSKNAIDSQTEINNPNININKMIEIYNKIIEEENKLNVTV